MKAAFDSNAPIAIRKDPMMKPVEIEAFSKVLESCQNYLEYGGGGSTNLVVAKGIPEILCVESDERYVAALRDRFASAAGIVNILHSDLGDVRPGGRPQPTQSRETNARLGQQYATAPWNILHAEGKVPDVILVDGRFRVNCALTSMLELPEKADPVFMLHDFSDERPVYREIEAFADPVELVRKLFIFKRARNFDAAKARAAQARLRHVWL